MTKKNLLILLSVISLDLALFPGTLAAQGNMLVTPRRVVFEDDRVFQEINLANTGHETAIYSISFIQFRMNDDGSFGEITKPDAGQYFADDHVRVFPRSVTLDPGEAQLIKLQLTGNENLEPGEYRSHLYFRAEPAALQGDETMNDLSHQQDKINVSLTPIYGITIPVIIRIGSANTSLSISGPTLAMETGTAPVLNLTLNRTGNFSVYGDLSVDYVSPKGVITPLAKVKGIAVYTPNTLRHIRIELTRPQGIDFNEGKLHMVYISRKEDKEEVAAVAELQLQR